MPQNKIEQLITELCPNGVDYVELGVVLNYEQPSKYLVATTNYDDSYVTPVLTAGQTFILGYTNEENGIYKASQENPVIIFDDFTTAFKWVDFPFKAKSSAMKMLNSKNKDKYDLRYVFFAMSCINYYTQDHARQWISNYSKITIPIPPLPIQEEIVKILDSFTELEANLEAELEARKKQYDHYRNWIYLINDSMKEMPLDELILSLKTWLNPRQNFTLNIKDAENYYVTVRELGWVDINFLDKTDRVNNEALRMINNRSNLEAWDVLFSGTGTIGRTALVKEKPKNWNIKEGVYVIKPNKQKINSKFLLFFLNSVGAKRQIENKIVGSPVSSIPMSELKKIKIPIPFKNWKPDLDKQQEIVTVLDRFDALVNNVSIGLPAELSARRKQYQYYRNILLTFKPLEK